MPVSYTHLDVYKRQFILSLLIPHPWPRAFIIMSVMAVVIKSANIPKEDAVKIGFTVFASSVPVSLIFLTGDATISPLAIQSSGVPLGWMGWFKLMGPPAMVGSILCYFLILVLFKPTQEISINKDEIRAKLANLGPMKGKEKRTAFWVAVAIILWMTDTLHGIDTVSYTHLDVYKRQVVFYCGVLQVIPDFILCVLAAELAERCYQVGIWLNWEPADSRRPELS